MTPYKLSIAPMMDITHRHFRQLLRLLSPSVELYTEMISGNAILHGNSSRLLARAENETPVVLQIGEGDAEVARKATAKAQAWNYESINLNAGCPSDKVQHGNFGAALMKDAAYCAQVYRAMKDESSVPVTVKCRIGIVSKKLNIDQSRYEDLKHFVETLAEAGCTKFIVHARVAILEGLSTKENREIPPLRYEDVYRLKSEFPQLYIGINGGIKTPAEMTEHLNHVDEVMIGRAICDNPWLLTEFNEVLGQANLFGERQEIVLRYLEYLKEDNPTDSPRFLLQPILELFNFLPGARQWRRALSSSFVPRQLSEMIPYVQQQLHSIFR